MICVSRASIQTSVYEIQRKKSNKFVEKKLNCSRKFFAFDLSIFGQNKSCLSSQLLSFKAAFSARGVKHLLSLALAPSIFFLLNSSFWYDR